MAIALDGNGIAAVIAASVAGIVSVGTFAMQVVSWRDNREIKRLSLARDVQIKQVKDLVNGKSDQLSAFVAKEAFEAGRTHEREAPNEPSPPVAVVSQDAAVLAPQIIPVKVPDNS
jgi:hypothetical protein